MSIDSFDIKLLNALQRDGRLTNHDLAETVGLSASQCSRRRQNLEESGIIDGYHAALSPEAIGLHVTVFVQVKFVTHSSENSAKFKALVNALPEVQEAFVLTGDTDYLVKLAVTDLRALSDILNNVFLEHASVAQVRSSIVLDRIKSTTVLPTEHLLAEGSAPASTGPRPANTKVTARRKPAGL